MLAPRRCADRARGKRVAAAWHRIEDPVAGTLSHPEEDERSVGRMLRHTHIDTRHGRISARDIRCGVPRPTADLSALHLPRGLLLCCPGRPPYAPSPPRSGHGHPGGTSRSSDPRFRKCCLIRLRLRRSAGSPRATSPTNWISPVGPAAAEICVTPGGRYWLEVPTPTCSRRVPLNE